MKDDLSMESNEKIRHEIKKIFEKRGNKTLNLARKAALEERIECKEVREALNYFMTKYWHDKARPTLLSLACEAVGGKPEETTPIAVPLILISGAIDIHDDIIDESKMKNGRVTVYGKFGKDIAILVGDALLFKGLILLSNVIKEMEQEKGLAISNVLKNMLFELGDAEAMELKLRKRFDVSPNEYLAIIEKKAADVEVHTRISAILGNGTRKEIESLGKYGRKLGMLIILGDDNADMINPEELSHRIKKEHIPLPILYAMQDPKIKPQLTAVLKKESLTEKDLEEIFEMVYDWGAFNRIEEIMKKLIQEGTAELENLRCCKPELRLLIESACLALK